MPTSVTSAPAFSVVIPTHNRQATIARAVKSVLAQTLTDFELLVVDDGSTDDSLQVLDSLQDGRLRVIRSPRRQGRSRARNRGLEEAQGRWTVFLDSDDEALPGWLEGLARLATEEAADVLCCGVVEVPVDRGRGEVVRLPRPLGPLYCGFRALFSPPGTFSVRRSVLAAIGGYDDSLEFSENSELALRLLPDCARRHRTVASVEEPLIRHYRRPLTDKVTADSANARLLAAQRILQRHGERYRRHNVRGLANYLAIAGVNAHRIGRGREGRAYLLAAVRTRPTDWRHWSRFALSLVPPIAVRFWRRPMAPEAT